MFLDFLRFPLHPIMTTLSRLFLLRMHFPTLPLVSAKSLLYSTSPHKLTPLPLPGPQVSNILQLQQTISLKVQLL